MLRVTEDLYRTRLHRGAGRVWEPNYHRGEFMDSKLVYSLLPEWLVKRSQKKS